MRMFSGQTINYFNPRTSCEVRQDGTVQSNTPEWHFNPRTSCEVRHPFFVA